MTNRPGELVVTNLTKRYDAPTGQATVLSGVSFSVRPGETVAIVGPSGSGKSTLLNIVGTLDNPTAGTVRLGDIEVTALKGNALADFRATRVGFIFQDHHLLPQLTALENVLLPTLAPHWRDLAARMPNSAHARCWSGWECFPERRPFRPRCPVANGSAWPRRAR